MVKEKWKGNEKMNVREGKRLLPKEFDSSDEGCGAETSDVVRDLVCARLLGRDQMHSCLLQRDCLDTARPRHLPAHLMSGKPREDALAEDGGLEGREESLDGERVGRRQKRDNQRTRGEKKEASAKLCLKSTRNLDGKGEASTREQRGWGKGGRGGLKAFSFRFSPAGRAGERGSSTCSTPTDTKIAAGLELSVEGSTKRRACGLSKTSAASLLGSSHFGGTWRST